MIHIQYALTPRRARALYLENGTRTQPSSAILQIEDHKLDPSIRALVVDARCDDGAALVPAGGTRAAHTVPILYVNVQGSPIDAAEIRREIFDLFKAALRASVEGHRA